MRKNIAVVFGGRSAEHDISILTGIQTLNAIDKSYYNVIPIYISSGGVFYSGSNITSLNFLREFNPLDKSLQQLTFVSGKPYIAFLKRNKYKSLVRIDCAILCLHGLNGEDGTIQGMLELCDIPYTSCGVLSSALCMDKIIMKDVFVANNIPTPEHFAISRTEFDINSKKCLEKICSKLSFPMIVKPSNLGSSIGISKAKTKRELANAIEIAKNYDERILIEKAIEPLREINCAVLGTTQTARASKLEEPISWQDILTFDEKYISEQKTNEKVVLSEEQSDLTFEEKTRIKDLAVKAYKIFYCSGVVRVDFLINSETKELFINEINTIPGSLANYLFNDMTYTELIEELIKNAFAQKIEKQKNDYSFSSTVILSYQKSSSKRRKKL